jgi:hypothetical protein
MRCDLVGISIYKIHMKRFLFLTCIIILIGILSCNKKEKIADTVEFPGWLHLKITELITDQHLCEITTVTFIEYNGNKYYHIYCGIWSCMYCQLFDEQGNRPDWGSKEWEDFMANKKQIWTVPACKP